MITGDFSWTQLNLAGNDLTRFESSVFLDVLETMVLGNGTVGIYESASTRSFSFSLF